MKITFYSNPYLSQMNHRKNVRSAIAGKTKFGDNLSASAWESSLDGKIRWSVTANIQRDGLCDFETLAFGVADSMEAAEHLSALASKPFVAIPAEA